MSNGLHTMGLHQPCQTTPRDARQKWRMRGEPAWGGLVALTLLPGSGILVTHTERYECRYFTVEGENNICQR